MFGFPKIDKAPNFQYKNNFLKTVSFQVNYSPIAMEHLIPELKALLKEYPNSEKVVSGQVTFNKEKVIDSQIEADGVAFSMKDNGISLQIKGDQLTYILQGNQYKNYKSFTEEKSTEFANILNLLNIKTVNRIAIRKVNVLNYKSTSNTEVSVADAIGIIFNSKLIENMKVFPEGKHLKRGINQLTLNNEHNWMLLTYGFIIGANEAEANGILDIDVFSQKETDTSKVFETFQEINSEIFNVFSWALQEEMRNKLNE